MPTGSEVPGAWRFPGLSDALEKEGGPGRKFFSLSIFKVVCEEVINACPKHFPEISRRDEDVARKLPIHASASISSKSLHPAGRGSTRASAHPHPAAPGHLPLNASVCGVCRW